MYIKYLKIKYMTPKTASVKVDQGLTKTGQNGTQTAEKEKSEVKLQKVGENVAIVPMPKKKMTVQQKLDSLHTLEGLCAKVEFLRHRKSEIEKFGTGVNGFTGAKMILEGDGCEDVSVSNPMIVEELIGIAKIKIKDLLIKAEREIEEFEIL